MVSRADSLSPLQKREVLYSDFASSFKPHPITKELIRLTDEDAVKQAIKNIVLTAIGERLFNPFIGSNVYRSLFEPASPFFAEDMLRYINSSIRQFETRVQVLEVLPVISADNNTVTLNINFSVINKPELVSFSFLLKRVR
mgnify:CR=1 FL=1